MSGLAVHMRHICALAIGVLACAAGCSGDRPQSILHPAGPAAKQIATLWWVMFGIYTAVFGVVLMLVVWGLLARRREHSALGRRFVFGCGVVIPTLILTGMLIYTIRVTRDLSSVPSDLSIEVVGHPWWWEVRYPDHDLVDANEIHIPAGIPVQLRLWSGGVVHSLWVPRLAGKRDLLPDHPTYLTIAADRPGVYRGICTEFCGGPHAHMGFRLVAHEPEEFEAWLKRRRRPPLPPADGQQLRGREVFSRSGCDNCHSIEGVSQTNIGPDLTHLGSRLTLAAGRMPNTDGNLAGWILNPQPLKPRNLMPPSYLDTDDLHDLLSYLRSLR